MKTGIELIAQERREQIEKHGRTVELDFANNNRGEMLEAAMALMEEGLMDIEKEVLRPDGWDQNIWNKMMSKPQKERLIIAGALLAAEIDRLNALSDDN